jgi:type IV secretory pathway TrbL component
MEYASQLLILLVGITILAAYGWWAIRDATLRRKSPVLVLIAVVGFFPLGLILWLLLRPPYLPPSSNIGVQWPDR